MLKFPKRKTDASEGAIVPWRPNFRNEQKLPDVKVIRTSFFINAAILALLLGGITFVAFEEVQLSELRAQTQIAQARFEKNRALSEATVALYKEYQAEEKRIKELDTFMSDRLRMREMVMSLSAIIPNEMAVTNLDILESGIKLQGYVSGLPTKASGYASAFEKSLKESKLFGSNYDQIKLSSLGRDQGSGRMRFTMDLVRTKTDPKKGKK